MQFPLETLEQRLLLSAGPTVYEQYLLSLVNRARANPAGEAALYGIDLNEGVPADELISTAPKQPLAFNPYLNSAADSHTNWMLDQDVFAHIGENGTNPGDRDALAGYEFTPPYAWGENLAYFGYFGQLPEVMSGIEQIHKDLFVDEGIAERGHRTSMLDGYFRETGVGLNNGVFTSDRRDAQVWMLTQEFAATAGNAFITGVAFADTMKSDGLYTPYEGLGGVTVEAQALDGSGRVFRTMTWDAGGYSLGVPAGQYALSAYGGDLPAQMNYGIVNISNENVLADLNATAFANVPSINSIGTVLVLGSVGNDYIAAQDLGDRVRIQLNGAHYDFARGAVNAIEIHAAAGDDYVDIAANLPITGISGDEGNDTILGGSSTDYIGGGDGDDVINGRFGNDSINGDAGHDLLDGRAGNDSIFGGKGRDSIFGGNHDDMLWGANAADYVDGESGNDTISGGPNFDTLMGGAGDDVILAADDSYDSVDGGEGRDRAEIDPLLDVVVNIEI